MPSLISEVSFFVGTVCWAQKLPKGFGVVLQSFLLEYKELQLLARIAVYVGICGLLLQME